MKDRAGFFAGCADVLTAMCVYYAVVGILIMNSRGWGLSLFWLLLCPFVCVWIFALLLKNPRSVPFLTAVTGGMFLAQMGVFILASATPLTFGYGFAMAVGAGMGAGLPLYYGLRRPLVHKHLTQLDVLVLTLLGLLLCREVLGIGEFTVALMVAVLLMDAAAAVGLRMTEGGEIDGASAFRAVLVALAGAVVLVILIVLLTAVFSRSGAVTGGVLHGIGAALAAVGKGIERFFLWLSKIFYKEQKYEALDFQGELPSLAGSEPEEIDMTLSLDPVAVTVVLCVLALAAAVAVALLLRKKKLARETTSVAQAAGAAVKRSDSVLGLLWARLKAAIRFRWTAFLLRNTPGGVFTALEFAGKRRKRPRQVGESMRQYISRMDGTGGLAPLADALDREYYGGQSGVLTAAECRKLRNYMRRAIRHG